MMIMDKNNLSSFIVVAWTEKGNSHHSLLRTNDNRLKVSLCLPKGLALLLYNLMAWGYGEKTRRAMPPSKE